MIAAVETPAPRLRPVSVGVTRPQMLRLGTVSRLLEGFAGFLPLAIWGGVLGMQNDGDGSRWFAGPLALPLLLEMAVGIFLQQRLVEKPLSVRFGKGRLSKETVQHDVDDLVDRHRRIWLFATMCLAAGILAFPLTRLLSVFGIGFLVFGLGIVGRWSAGGELMRASLSNSDCWKGMNRLNLVFYVGMAVAGITVCLLPGRGMLPALPESIGGNVLPTRLRTLFESSPDTYVLAAAMVMAVTGAVACLLAWRISACDANLPDTMQSSLLPAAASIAEPCPVSAACEERADCAGDATTCEASTCCSARVTRPMPFWLGMLFAAIGFVTLWGVTSEMLFRCALSTWPLLCAVALLIGLPVGCAVFQRITPDTGYTLLLIPFLAGGLVTVSASWFLLGSGWVFALPALLAGICIGGVACGTDAVVGESFDEATALRSRARVLSLGCLIAAIALPLFCAMPSAVFAAGLACVRAIPNPLLSSRAVG